MTTLIILNDEIKDIIEIVKSLEDSVLLLEGITKTVQNEVKEQKRGFRIISVGTLGASLLGTLLADRGWGVNRAGKGKGISRAVDWVLRAGYGNNEMDF